MQSEQMTVHVEVPPFVHGGYDINIGSGTLENLWDRLNELAGGKNLFIITDSNLVVAGHLPRLLGTEKAQLYIIDPPGEISKNIKTVVQIINAMEQAFIGRDTCIIALGGGTVGDIAGFAAAIFKRGVDVIHIPTTTVSQADSAIGGKTGVDSMISKNAFGAFYHPKAVFIDVDVLSTLDERQYASGLAESVKHALIADAKYFEYLENNIEKLLQRDRHTLCKIAAENCRIKASVVQADPTEKNQRRMLNYGHTIGHAVETVSDYQLLHGEAVAIGMIAAGRIENKLGLVNDDRIERIEKILTRLSLPVRIDKSFELEKILDVLKRDKKAVNAWPKFVLLEEIGKVHAPQEQFAVDVEREIAELAIQQIKSNH